jgi:DNA polymerase-3 subunit alpha
VRERDRARYVRLGHQFCVRDGAAAVSTLTGASFTARMKPASLAAGVKR